MTDDAVAARPTRRCSGGCEDPALAWGWPAPSASAASAANLVVANVTVLEIGHDCRWRPGVKALADRIVGAMVRSAKKILNFERSDASSHRHIETPMRRGRERGDFAG